MNDVFKIKIDDGSDFISEFAVKQNMNQTELYDWQKRAIEYFFLNDRAIFEVTTGAGKTFCSISIIKRAIEIQPDIKILIVVPKNVILESTWYKELYEAGIGLKDIGVYYGAIKEYGKITITNMQNLHKIALDIFDFAIFDEVHNYGTKRLLPFLEHPFKYKLGLSATVERADNAHWDLMRIFDYNIFKYSPHQALEEGILNPFDFYNVGVEMDYESMERYIRLTQDLNVIFQMGGGYGKIMRTTSGLKYRMLSKMNERKTLVNNYPRKFGVVKAICEKHKDDKILVFSQFNEQTNKMYWHLLDVGIRARVMHSGIPKEKRTQDLIDFKNDKFNVLLTSKVLDEGYNLPSIDTAIITAGDSTAKQTIQRLGRVLRRKKKKSTLYQIYCLNTVEEEQSFNRSRLFKDLCSEYDSYTYQDGELNFKL